MCQACESDYGSDVGDKCPRCGAVIEASTESTSSEIIVTMVIKYSGKIADPIREGVTYRSPNFSGFSDNDKTLINKLLEETGLPEL